MSEKFTPSAQHILQAAFGFAKEFGHSYVGSEHLLLGILFERDCAAAKLLEAKGIRLTKCKQLVAELMGLGTENAGTSQQMTPRTRSILERCGAEAMRAGHTHIASEHLLLAILKEPDAMAGKIITAQGVSGKDLIADIHTYLDSFSALQSTALPISKPENRKHPPVQSALAQYGRDLTQLAADGKLDPVLERDAETERLIQILSRRTKNNPCLIGEPGVGKTAVVEGLAIRIAAQDVPQSLLCRSIISLDLSAMIAGAKYRGEFEDRMKQLLKEIAASPQVILFIDELHTLVGAGAAEGAVDAANILKPALARGDIRLIGATTIAEYRRHIEKDAALERRFQSVSIREPSPDAAIRILKGLRAKYEAHHHVIITDEAISAAVQLSVRYLSDRFLPDKAIDLIDEAASKAHISRSTLPNEIRSMEAALQEKRSAKEAAIRAQQFEEAALLRNDEEKAREAVENARINWENDRSRIPLSIGKEEIAEIVTAWTQIPLTQLTQSESERLLHLEKTLQERITGQNEAIHALAGAIRRGRTALKDPKRPIGSFLFLGPTGVGKTEVAKSLALTLFGTQEALIRFDMSEYMEAHSVSKLIGSPPGYVGFEEGGQLTEQLRRHPYSVILFDEAEKANPDIFHLLLQIMDDGILTDAQGHHIDCRNIILILTSNIGASVYSSKGGTLGFSDPTSSIQSKKEEQIMREVKQYFQPEFLNRLDEIIRFTPLSKDDLYQITRRLLSDLAVRLSQSKIFVSFSDTLVTHLVETGANLAYGARPLRRQIQREVEDLLANALLENKIPQEEPILLTYENGSVRWSFTKDTLPVL